jgi:hypothetical protein
MDRNEALKKIPKQGFLKLTRDQTPPLTGAQRTVLIRKGNELFNKGDFEKAKKIFLTTGYTDGIIRMGDYYIKKQNVLEAFRMYKLAPAPDKVENLIMQMAGVLQHWLKEGE